jgi:hypothetical protein
MELFPLVRSGLQTSSERLRYVYCCVRTTSFYLPLEFTILCRGNDGEEGAWYSSSPATGVDIVTVGSTDNTIVYWQQANVSTGYGPITYTSFTPLPVNGSRPIYATSNDTTIANDACVPLPASTPDLSPYVVIIRRGGCNFVSDLVSC